MANEACGVCFGQCPCATCGNGQHRLVNLTPHNIVLAVGEERITLPSEGIARVDSTPGVLRNIVGVPVPVADRAEWGEIIGLPEPRQGVLYIVSALVLSRCHNRDDVVSPGTGPKDGAIRNAAGQIEAVTRLVR